MTSSSDAVSFGLRIPNNFYSILSSFLKNDKAYYLIKNLPHTYISLGTVYTVLNQNVAIMMNLKKKETLDFERKTYSLKQGIA